MNTVIINGRRISGGRTVVVSGGKIIVDGTDVTPDVKEINITIAGNVERVEVGACNALSITGDVVNLKTASGDVTVTGNIIGSVQTASGDVDCVGSIGGSVSTMSGDIKSR